MQGAGAKVDSSASGINVEFIYDGKHVEDYETSLAEITGIDIKIWNCFRDRSIEWDAKTTAKALRYIDKHKTLVGFEGITEQRVLNAV